MGCKKTAVKVIKGIAKIVTPEIVRRAGEVVGLVQELSAKDPTLWTNDEKRRYAVRQLIVEARKQGVELRESVARLLIEYALAAVVKAKVKVEDLSADDTGEPATV